MKHLLLILAFLISAYCWNSNISPTSLNKARVSKLSQTSYCGLFSNKSTFNSDLVYYALNLMCDSTFIFLNRPCFCGTGSEGTWSIVDGKVLLKTSKEVLDKKDEMNRKLEEYKKRKIKYPCKQSWLDLTGTTIVFKDSFIVWKDSPNSPDTLYRE